MPLETIIYNNQARYYEALQRSNRNKTGVDCAPFIDFMLEAIENTMYKYVDVATTTTTEQPDSVGVNVGVKEKILDYIATYPQITITQLAQFLKVSTRTIERHLKELREAGKIRREGSDKIGYWRINE